MSNIKLTADDVQVIAPLIRKGYNFTEIAKRYHVAPNTIHDFCIRYNIDVSHKHPYSPEVIQQMQHLWNDCDYTSRQIAHELLLDANCVCTTICRLRKKGVWFKPSTHSRRVFK